ncbi:MAG: site-specific integrase [Erysipelotrichia bacterium]|nr:site-specific integrase [Erysipelotrichia bacterium]
MKDYTPNGLTGEQWSRLVSDFDQNQSTVNDYRKVLNQLHSFESLNILTMTREQAEDYFMHLDQRVAEGSLKDTTAHRYKATLRSLGCRIEQQNLVPDYVNPFHGLVQHEQRNRSVYTNDSFADPELIQKIRSVCENNPCGSILIHFLMDMGLSPNQISALKVSDFHMEDHHLTVDSESDFLEKCSDPWYKSPMYLQGLPITYIKASKTNITWRYTGTFCFNDDYMEILRRRTPTLGINRDTRLYFHTPRHLPCSYRTIHHLIREFEKTAGIGNDITPMQLSIYGSICCSMQLQGIEIPGVKPIGIWKDRLPTPRDIQIQSIASQLGSDALNHAVGL